MSKEFELNAEPRQEVGKGASRRLRKTNHVPAVVYGLKKPALSLVLNHNQVIKALDNEAFYSHILTLKIDGKAESVVLKALQRHEYKPKINHLDFLRINMSEKMTMNVPLHFINESNCPGVKQGGLISHIMTEVEVTCLPKDLPEFIEVDLSNAELEHPIHLSHIVPPKGVTLVAIAHNEDPTIATVHKPRAVVEDEPAVAAPPAEVPASQQKAEDTEDKE